MSTMPDTHAALVAEIRRLIDGARRRAAAAVNAELTLLYWQGGREESPGAFQPEPLQGKGGKIKF